MNLTFTKIQEGGSESAWRVSARAEANEVLFDKGANQLHIWLQRAFEKEIRAAGKFVVNLKVLSRLSLGRVMAGDQVVLEPVPGNTQLWPADSNPNTQVLYVPRTSDVKAGDIVTCTVQL